MDHAAAPLTSAAVTSEASLLFTSFSVLLLYCVFLVFLCVLLLLTSVINDDKKRQVVFTLQV